MGMIIEFLVLMAVVMVKGEGELQVGFYNKTCSNAESFVFSVVKNASLRNSRVPAMLLRLHFHDCFVEGCDGSILIDNVPHPEKGAFEHQGVNGYREIQTAKEILEAQCPGVVSCADIVAMAARDSVVLSGGRYYQVETGRRDGRVSDMSLAANMPDVDDSIETLKSKFFQKGLTPQDLVLLTAGAHTIGSTACFFMPNRLYNFTGKNDTDPSINSTFLRQLESRCPNQGDVNARIPLDPTTTDTFDDKVIQNVKNGFAVIASDARLYDDNVTRGTIDSYLYFASIVDGFFDTVFPPTMVRMGRIGVKTGQQGEIRRFCNSFNK